MLKTYGTCQLEFQLNNTPPVSEARNSLNKAILVFSSMTTYRALFDFATKESIRIHEYEMRELDQYKQVHMFDINAIMQINR